MSILPIKPHPSHVRATYVSLIWRVDRVSKTVYLVAVCTCDREQHYKESAADLYPDDAIHSEQTPLNHLCGESDLLSVMNRRWHNTPQGQQPGEKS